MNIEHKFDEVETLLDGFEDYINKDTSTYNYKYLETYLSINSKTKLMDVYGRESNDNRNIFQKTWDMIKKIFRGLWESIFGTNKKSCEHVDEIFKKFNEQLNKMDKSDEDNIDKLKKLDEDIRKKANDEFNKSNLPSSKDVDISFKSDDEKNYQNLTLFVESLKGNKKHLMDLVEKLKKQEIELQKDGSKNPYESVSSKAKSIHEEINRIDELLIDINNDDKEIQKEIDNQIAKYENKNKGGLDNDATNAKNTVKELKSYYKGFKKYIELIKRAFNYLLKVATCFDKDFDFK